MIKDNAFRTRHQRLCRRAARHVCMYWVLLCCLEPVGNHLGTTVSEFGIQHETAGATGVGPDTGAGAGA